MLCCNGPISEFEERISGVEKIKHKDPIITYFQTEGQKFENYRCHVEEC